MGAYNDDVLFVHIPKCGGTAVKQYMADTMPDVRWPRPASWFTGPDAMALSQQAATESRLPIGHIPLRDIEGLTGRPLDSWDKIIATIRNPYQQTVSQWWFWHHRYAIGDNHPHSMYAGMHPRIHTWLKGDQTLVEFHQWYESRFHGEELLLPKMDAKTYTEWGGMYWYWLSVNDVLPPNLTIVKQEEMAHQIPLLLAPYMDGPPPPLPMVNKGSPINWELVYTASGKEAAAESLDLVTLKFRWCLEQGYYERLIAHES